MVDGPVIEELGRNNLLDDLLLNLFAELFGGDGFAVLRRDDHSIYTQGNHGTTVVLVLDSDLRLGVWPQPGEGSVVPGFFHGRVELMGEKDGLREKLGSLIGGIAEHDTLITGTELLQRLLIVETLRNVGRLLLNRDENVAGFVVEAFGGIVIADIFDGVADDVLVVKVSLGGDFTKDHDHARLGGRFTSDLGQGVFLEAGIEDRIGHLVTEDKTKSVLQGI
jgi:hypothetical protein